MQDYRAELVDIVRDYLGPAAERFVNRQIVLSFDKPITHLRKKDIVRLSFGISAGLRVLTHRNDIVEEVLQRMKNLANHTGG